MFGLPTVRHYTHSRYALMEAYRLSGVGSNGALLAPAYHCRTMLDPAQALKAQIAFYELDDGLIPNIDSIAVAYQQNPVPVRALLVPHYFGAPQPDKIWSELVHFCQSKNIQLIEDCAHAWQIVQDRAKQGDLNTGHFITASPYKFFGSDSGGVLWGKSEAPIENSTASLKTELRSALGSFRRWRANQQHVPIEHIDHAFQMASGDTQKCGQDFRESSDATSDQFDPTQCRKESTLISRWIVKLSDTDYIAKRRREVFRQWLEACKGLSKANRLFETIDEKCTPYMFPLLIKRPQIDFFVLKRMGVPVWRWDDIAATSCRTSTHYRLHLLHLPCHQSLSNKQVEWMTATVRKVLQ
jgi:perosamine synthetase